MGIPCAKKEFHLKEEEPLFLKEAGILSRLKHPCIVNFICCGNGEQRGDRFIAMELMEKSLFDLIEDQKGVRFSLPVVVDIMLQKARGMCYSHDQGVAHRDLKPHNVVVNRLSFPHLVDHFDVKLVDFGMSKTKVQVSKSNTISIRGVGTTHYRAPEVHPKAYPNNTGKAVWFKADVFSYAMTCAHVLTLRKPFEDVEMRELYEAVIGGRRPELPGDCPEELDALLRDCWNTSPRLRPSFREICTRLEALRYQMLRGFLTGECSNSRLQRSSSISYEIIAAKSKNVSSVRRPSVVIRGVEIEPINQMKNLPWIEGNSESNTALDEWTEKRTRKVKDELYQVIGFFSVLMGTMFTSVAQSTQSNDETLSCRIVWIPVIFTLLAWANATVALWRKVSPMEIVKFKQDEEDQARRVISEHTLCFFFSIV
ncbi:hypothetical protein KC19_8G186800 [Ceratodon purpureus]|uniref:Protein kinase domain-containing protein n=1 Tax=Ceratodon purpureus TaxID=3225 RepID=A0A8T0GZX1_CERPU|nr:hypothetical protein KC19_8G186800 [Ceratodon purpureus]